VSPATAVFAAFCSVAHGAAIVPTAESLPVVAT